MLNEPFNPLDGVPQGTEEESKLLLKLSSKGHGAMNPLVLAGLGTEKFAAVMRGATEADSTSSSDNELTHVDA